MSRMILPLLVVLAGESSAQVPTSAAIQGKVTRADGSPIADATVVVTNESTGRRWEIRSRSSGAYLLEDVGIGGPFRMETRAIGHEPATRSGDVLFLGQRLIADFVLQPTSLRLATVEVVATPDRALDRGRTGPAEIVSRSRIADLPNPGGDFLALTLLSPQTATSSSAGTANTGGITIGGQNRLYNSFQIDGGVAHDVYRGRLPGRETLPRPISLEALEEIQLLAAPFDVRHGAFAGGLVNAVTRSGTNDFRGSAFASLSDAALVGRNASGEPRADFTNWRYGATAAGPIVRNRIHYFVSGDIQRESTPDPGPVLSESSSAAEIERIRVSYASAARFRTILRDSFQVEPGTLGPVNGQRRSLDLFSKVTVQLGTNSQLELSHHIAQGDRWGFISRTPGFYFLSLASQRNPSTSSGSRFDWSRVLRDRWSNELIASRLRLDDSCRPDAAFPVVRVGPAGAGQLVAGAEGGCPVRSTNRVVQDVLEVADNVTGALGDHAITIGIHGLSARVRDDLVQNSSGVWMFESLDRLASGNPSGYQRTVPGPRRTGALDFRTGGVGMFLQDRWTASPRMTATFGLRLDVPIVSRSPQTNEALRSALGLDTGDSSLERALWSPRVGVNYDVHADGRMVLRGGAGVFTGPPPYMWLANAHRDDGLHELFLSCAGVRAPTFDPFNSPDACADGSGPVPRVSFLGRDARFPQSVKVAAGIDHRFRNGIATTVDVLYTRALHQLYATDANLRGPTGVAQGEGDRVLYGTMRGSLTSLARAPARFDPAFGQVVRLGDSSGDDALSVSLHARKELGTRVTVSGFYSFTRARDRMSLVNPAARANLENTPLDGNLDTRPLRTSYFETPHRVHLAATLRLPARASLSLLYAGAAGTPFTYAIDGDANADGIPSAQFSNDIVYVPRRPALGDISLVVFDSTVGTLVAAPPAEYERLDAFIEAEACLRRQRGRILQRNSCRNPWTGTLSARLAKAFPIGAARSLEVTADVYNLLNVFNARWGRVRRTGLDPSVRMLTIVGYDEAAERGVYRLALPVLRRTLDRESQWRAEVGARLAF